MTPSLQTPNSSKSTTNILKPVFCNKNNHAYILDKASSTVIPSGLSSNTNLALLIMDSISDLITHAMTPTDLEEYANCAWLNPTDHNFH